jgi:hypothetical protein
VDDSVYLEANIRDHLFVTADCEVLVLKSGAVLAQIAGQIFADRTEEVLALI